MKIDLSYDDSNLLRGLAILAVVLVHLLAFLHGIYTTSPYHLVFISLDQLSRFCVPLFLLLSGYGLTKKYSTQEFGWKKYLQSRVIKLIPLYLLWSLVSHVLFIFEPQWAFANQPHSLIQQLFLGQADYQLYFLPLIFQLYLIFPLLLQALRKHPYATLIITLVLQFGFYTWISHWWPGLSVPKWESTDQSQYVFFVTWVGYFVTGMWLAYVAVPEILKKIVPMVSVVASILTIYTAAIAISHGVDPIIALRFTRWPVMLYALSLCLSLIFWRVSLTPDKLNGRVIMGNFHNFLNWLGKESYVIFLAHTIGLRLLFSAINQQISALSLVALTGVWVVTIFVSRKLSS